MSSPMSAAQTLDREFLEIRARLLEVAASLDRIDRGGGSVEDDPRMNMIWEAIEILEDEKSDRAEQIQLIFSREYEDDWQKKFDIPVTN